MRTRFANLTGRLAALLVMLCTLAACGGGGGSSGGFLPNENQGELWLGIVMYDSQGNPTNTVTSTSPATIEVTVRRNGRNGKLLADILVEGDASLGAVFPAVGTALSNANGVATFQLEVGNLKGAGTFSARAANDEGVVTTETLSYQAGASGLRMGYFDDNQNFIENEIGVEPDGVLAASGTAQLTVAILAEDGSIVSSTESVRFNSSCLSSGQATLSPASPVSSGNGRVTTTYTASGCAGSDQVTATLVGASAQAFTSLEIAPPTANRLDFVSAEPPLIVLKGTGGGPDRQEASKVTFRAVDSNNEPLQSIEVSFTLTTYVGGLTVSPTTATTDPDGNVTTTVFSGDIATVVRVIATAGGGDGGGDVSTVSDVLTVSTGLPDQNSISMSVEGNFVVEEGFSKDGIARTITVRMADKFNNPVPNGTAAVFTTEYGSIDSSCEIGRRNGDRIGGVPLPGLCSVGWVSQAPKFPLLDDNQELVRTIFDSDYDCPSHNGNSGPCPDDLGMIGGGRSTILVTAIGEESFIDSNGNGIFDQVEAQQGLFSNLTEAFVDTNENGLYDRATEACLSNPNTLTCRAGREDTFVDFNNNAVFDANGDDPDNGYPDEGVEAMYNGLLCPKEGDGNWCSRELVNVRDTLTLILSADPNWDIALYRGRFPEGSTNTNGGPYTAYISDAYNNKPTGGSTVKVEASGSCTIIGKSSFEVPNTTAPGAFAIVFDQGGEIEYDSCDDPLPDTRGDLTITLTPQDGGPEYSETWTCRVNLVDTAPDPLCP